MISKKSKLTFKRILFLVVINTNKIPVVRSSMPCLPWNVTALQFRFRPTTQWILNKAQRPWLYPKGHINHTNVIITSGAPPQKIRIRTLSLFADMSTSSVQASLNWSIAWQKSRPGPVRVTRAFISWIRKAICYILYPTNFTLSWTNKLWGSFINLLAADTVVASFPF